LSLLEEVFTKRLRSYKSWWGHPRSNYSGKTKEVNPGMTSGVRIRSGLSKTRLEVWVRDTWEPWKWFRFRRGLSPAEGLQQLNTDDQNHSWRSMFTSLFMSPSHTHHGGWRPVAMETREEAAVWLTTTLREHVWWSDGTEAELMKNMQLYVV